MQNHVLCEIRIIDITLSAPGDIMFAGPLLEASGWSFANTKSHNFHLVILILTSFPFYLHNAFE